METVFCPRGGIGCDAPGVVVSNHDDDARAGDDEEQPDDLQDLLVPVVSLGKKVHGRIPMADGGLDVHDRQGRVHSINNRLCDELLFHSTSPLVATPQQRRKVGPGGRPGATTRIALTRPPPACRHFRAAQDFLQAAAYAGGSCQKSQGSGKGRCEREGCGMGLPIQTRF